MTNFAIYPVTPAANSRITFLGPKAPPLKVNARVQPVRALMKFGTSFMEVAWEPEHDLAPQNDLSFSEVMALPAGEVEETGEYFEIYNRTDRAVSLEGFSVEDAHGNVLTTFTAGNGQTTIPPRSFLVAGQSLSASENDGADVAYAYGAPLLPDLAGTLKLVKRVPIDTLDYKQSTPGVALVFDPNPFILSTDSVPGAAPPHLVQCHRGRGLRVPDPAPAWVAGRGLELLPLFPLPGRRGLLRHLDHRAAGHQLRRRELGHRQISPHCRSRASAGSRTRSA